jgi:hypothetical protein
MFPSVHHKEVSPFSNFPNRGVCAGVSHTLYYASASSHVLSFSVPQPRDSRQEQKGQLHALLPGYLMI